MEQGVAPEWVTAYLPILLWTAIVIGAVWLVLAFFDYRNRQAYNLTMSDRGGASGEDPGFLKVDKEKRDAAIAAGEAFDRKVAAKEAARAAAEAPSTSTATGVAGWGAGIFAFLTMITAVIGAFGRVEYYDSAARQLTNVERLGEIIGTYWLGFIIVLILIAIQIWQFATSMKKS